MKKLFKATFAIALTSMLLFSCSKSEKVTAPDKDNLVKVTIIAGNPEVNPGTKTEIVGTTPYWSVGDAIGVSNGTSTNYKFSTDIAARAEYASFTGTTAVSSTLYAYYPYTSNGVGLIQDTYYGAKVDLPNNQNPTATSFDGKADIMVAKPFTVDPENTTVDNLKFARLGAVVKIVLIDKDNTMTGTQHPSTVSMTAESTLAGRLLIDMQNQNLQAPYYNATSSVTANYTTETKYAIDGTNATYLIVYPQTLAEGSTLTIAASTEDYTLSKDITVPAGGIELQAGKVTTLKVKFAAGNITAGAGAALPFNDDFSWQTETGETGLSSVDEAYSAFENVYEGKASGVIRLGKSTAVGYLTTKELDLSSAFYVVVSARAYNAGDNSKIKVTVDGETSQTASTAMTSTDTFTDYIFNFSAATKKSKVTITTDTKRAVLTDLQIISGTYVFPPVINVTTDNPMAIDKTAGSHTIQYTIDNPTTATLSASTTASWISNINCSTSGQVTFNVAAQTGAAARSGVITLSYTGAPDVEVTVNQAGDVVKGASWSYTFTQNQFSNNSADLTDGTSTLTWTSSIAPGYTNDALSFGTNGSPSAATLSTSSYTGGVEKIAISIKGNSGKKVTAAVSVGGTALKCGGNTSVTQSGNTLTTYEFTPDNLVSGMISISFTNPNGGYQIKTISINPAPATQLTMSDITCTEHTSTSLTFGWDAVEGATGYQVSTDGGSTYSSTQPGCTYTWSGLLPETSYTIWVKAIGDGTNYLTSDSKSAVGTTDANVGPATLLELDMTTKTYGTSSYNVSTTYGDWTIVNGANNNKGWTYFKMGGKSATLDDYNPCYIYSTAATTAEAGKVTVHLPAGSLSKNGMSVTSWGVYVYSDSSMNTQVDYVAGGTITNSEGSFDFEPSAGKTWASGSYFKVSWTLANTTNTNGVVCVDKITVYCK